MEFIEIDGIACAVSKAPNAECLLIQPCDAQEFAALPAELEMLRADAQPFDFAAFAVENWNRDLSPWQAPPVFGKDAFDGSGEETRIWLESSLLSQFRSRRVILGGYSLAGLFSLWCATRSSAYDAIAAASPSVWFPGWIDYAEQMRFLARRVYLSLGDREHRSKNPQLRTVRDAIERLNLLLGRQSVNHTLEWNEGTHFSDPVGRTVKAFRWAMQM